MSWFPLAMIVMAAGVSAVGTRTVIHLATRWRVVDDPSSDPDRKRHGRIVPLLGGWAIIGAVLLCLWFVQIWPGAAEWRLSLPQIIGITLAGLTIMIGGGADDRWRLRPAQQLIAPVVAIACVVAAGIGVTEIRNPFGGMIDLSGAIVTIGPITVTIIGGIFTAIWLFVTMYATKLLDGIDGLVTGVGLIGAVIVFLLTLRPEVHQPHIGLLALIVAGATAGFLCFNWHPAKIFLGESGSLWIGFVLGLLAIIAGGKLATALLVLGLPILDLVAVILYRAFILHQSPFRTSDRSHLHFRLLDQGWSVRRTVLFLYAVTAIFGFSTLIVHGLTKVFVLGFLVVMMVSVATYFIRRTRSAHPTA